MAENISNQFNLRRLILLSTLARLVIAGTVELGNDEAYYFTYALQPDWNHFDHPPLVGLFIRLFTVNLHWITDFTMRLTSVLGAALCTWLIAKCGQLIRNERTGYFAAVLYTASVYTSIIAGIFIIPDSPQLVFWLSSLYCMLLLIGSTKQEEKNKSVLWLGLWIGLACMCKIHGIFLWFGFGVYILLYNRQWLKNPFLYLSALLTILIVCPVVFWNFNNHFVTWQFHSERVEISNEGLNLKAFLTMLVGQFFYNNPIVVLLGALAILAVSRNKSVLSVKFTRLLLWTSLPLIIVSTMVSLFRSTLPHWSGPGFISLMLLSAAFLDYKIAGNRRQAYRRLLQSALGLVIFAVVAGIAIIRFYPGTLSNQPYPRTGKGDATLDMYGWQEFRKTFVQLRNNDIRQHVMTEKTPILVNKWFPGGHLLYYISHPLGIPVIGEGTLKDLHKFAWLNKQQGYLSKGNDAYYIIPSNYYTDPSVVYRKYFESISLAKELPQTRGGEVARYWYIYRLKRAKKDLGVLIQ